jgi:hypothetical protein
MKLFFGVTQETLPVQGMALVTYLGRSCFVLRPLACAPGA